MLLAQADIVADPIAEHMRAAAEGAGLPPWAVTLVAVLAPVVGLLAREWIVRRRADATVRAIIQGVEAGAETLPAHQAAAIKRAIAGAATAAGVEPRLQRAVKCETAKMAAERAHGNGAPSAAPPGPARPHTGGPAALFYPDSSPRGSMGQAGPPTNHRGGAA